MGRGRQPIAARSNCYRQGSPTCPIWRFVEVLPGIEGLVHISEMSWTKRVTNPEEVLTPGEEVAVKSRNSTQKPKESPLAWKKPKAIPGRMHKWTVQTGPDDWGDCQKVLVHTVFCGSCAGHNRLCRRGATEKYKKNPVNYTTGFKREWKDKVKSCDQKCWQRAKAHIVLSQRIITMSSLWTTLPWKEHAVVKPASSGGILGVMAQALRDAFKRKIEMIVAHEKNFWALLYWQHYSWRPSPRVPGALFCQILRNWRKMWPCCSQYQYRTQGIWRWRRMISLEKCSAICPRLRKIFEQFRQESRQ